MSSNIHVGCVVAVGLVLSLTALVARADEFTHSYVAGETVSIFANKMGPFDNPLETYAYFELPVCPPSSWDHKFPSLGQALVGDELYRMKIDAAFPKEGEKFTSTRKELCTIKPTEAEAARWTSMVQQQYWYQLYIDDLPVWATFGRLDEKQQTPQIYTHQSFRIGVNGDRIVFANLTASNLVSFSAGQPIQFSYDVTIEPMKSITFEDRFRRYLDNAFFNHRIHWFSIFNSFMMVLFLMGLVLTILSRTLRADYARFSRERDDIDAGLVTEWADESGWKQLATDVFRVPPACGLLCSLYGTGWQLVILMFSIIIISIVTVLYTSPGSTLTYGVLAFAVTSYIAGSLSATMFADFAAISPAIAGQWMATMGLTAAVYPLPVMLLGFLMNFVAILYDSAQAIPFGGMIAMLLLWGLVSLPLVVLGTIVGRNRRSSSREAPPHVGQIPRMVREDRPWFWRRSFLILCGGALPFASIFIELYFVFTSFWNYKMYYVFGFLLLVFIILLLSTACEGLVLTYFLLNSEDHRWHWASFMFGASTAGYVFLYAVFFYFFRTRMSGLFMFVFYFGYMGMLCVGIGIMCGAVSYAASRAFVVRIYRNVKGD